ncbi:hypothetical protein PYW07_013118 [Mythimna separata]|uniref:Uncharacterized protein n=1 Tax=Mythimna separata TaxID=271217 RepID=A0AAD8DJZ1_MYTSE|nr:hypothetical protein PYW07_013118 [Mythimna separata]
MPSWAFEPPEHQDRKPMGSSTRSSFKTAVLASRSGALERPPRLQDRKPTADDMASWDFESPPGLQDRKLMSSSIMEADMASWAFERPAGVQDWKPTAADMPSWAFESPPGLQDRKPTAADMDRWAFDRPMLQNRVLHGRQHSGDEGPTTSGSTMTAFDPGAQAVPPPLQPNIIPTSSDGSTNPLIQLQGLLDDHPSASGCRSRKNFHQTRGTALTVTRVTSKSSGTLEDQSPGCSSPKNFHQIQGIAPTGSGFTAKGSGIFDDHPPASGSSSGKNCHPIQRCTQIGSGSTAKGSNQIHRASKKQLLNATTCDYVKTFDQIQDTFAQVQPMATGSGYTRTTYQLERNLVQQFPVDTNGSGGVAVVQLGPSALATDTSGQVEEYRWNSPWIFPFNLTRIARVFSHLRRRLGLLTVTVSLANFCLKVLSVTPVSM